MTVELIQGDCLDVMPTLTDKSVDMVFTDPPYNLTDLEYDKIVIDDSWCKELIKVVKKNGYLATFGNFMMFASIGQLWKWRFNGIWLKPSPNPRTHSAKKPMNQQESYCVFAHPESEVKYLTWNIIKNIGKPYKKTQRNTGYKRGGKDQISRASCSGWTKTGYESINDGYRIQSDVIRAPQKQCMIYDERTVHPTQKPIQAIGVLIQWLTNEGDTILDPFMGSGTTGVAAQRLGRNFIGIELDPEYFAMAKKRIENDMPLFNTDIK